MTHGSLFSGIGGFDLAAEWIGWTNIFQVEIDEFCQKVLTKNFPNVKRYKDIKEFSGKEYEGRINIVSGGFPCQPFSIAGKRKGKEDDRYLWDEVLRVIAEVKPQWCVIENVSGLLTIDNGLVFEQVLSDLESKGFETQPFIVPACSQNAPHRRDRVWIVANSNTEQRERTQGRFQSELVNGSREHSTKDARQWNEQREADKGELTEMLNKGTAVKSKRPIRRNAIRAIADTETERLQEQKSFSSSSSSSLRETPSGRSEHNQWAEDWYEVATRLCRVDDGLPKQLHRNNRLKALGNAIVPQIAYEIFKAINETSLAI